MKAAIPWLDGNLDDHSGATTAAIDWKHRKHAHSHSPQAFPHWPLLSLLETRRRRTCFDHCGGIVLLLLLMGFGICSSSFLNR